MTKKILLLAGLVLMMKATSFGQAACTADPQYTNTTTQKGTWPNTTVNMAPATVGKPYSQTLTLVFPKDTTIIVGGVPYKASWDSTVAVSYTGLPTSLSLTPACWNPGTKPSRCAWVGNSIGCSIITGTPVTADIGTWNIVVNTNNYLAGQKTPQAYAITGYKIIVSAPAGINEDQKTQTLLQNNPNPFGDKSEIFFNTEETGSAEFRIYDMIGKVVYKSMLQVASGSNKIELNAKDYEPGLYFYSVIFHSNAFTRKMVISK